MTEFMRPWVAAEDWVNVELAEHHPQGADIPPIGTFVQGHIDRTGDTYRALQQRSGSAVHHSAWEKLAKNKIKEFPKPDTIRAMAATLSLSETTVVLAIARTLGLDVSHISGSIIPIPNGAEALDARQRRVIWETVMAFLPPVTEAQAKSTARRAAKKAVAAESE